MIVTFAEPVTFLRGRGKKGRGLYGLIQGPSLPAEGTSEFAAVEPRGGGERKRGELARRPGNSTERERGNAAPGSGG